MWTQRDQIQAYQFLRRRLVSALQAGDANHPVSPSRRLVLGYAAGTVVAVLVVAVFGIIGVLRPGSGQQWRTPGRVVIEKETGARYVLLADGLLHPVANFASARLLAGGGGTATVSAKSLAGVPRGVPIGIADAPDSLPAPDRLLTGPWTVCAGASTDGPPSRDPTTTVLLGVAVNEGRPVGDGDAVIVAEPTGARYAVFAGKRWRLKDRAAEALGFDQAAPIAVTAAWLSATPVGTDLGLIAVEGSGGSGPRIGATSTVAGQVLVADTVGGDRRFFVVRPSGVSAVTEIEAALILANPANRSAYAGGTPRPIQVSAADIPGRSGGPSELPARTPRPLSGGRLVCANSDGVRLIDTLPAAVRPLPAQGNDALVADGVFVPPGSGAVVRDQQSPDAQNGTVYLITDRGIRYPLGGQAAQALGYGAVTPTPIASTILALFPTGATLDPTSPQLTPSR
jgi:type VII secretion protein EccB